MSTPACLLHLGGPPETSSSARAAWPSQSPGKELLVGASYSSCIQACPSSTSGPQCRPWRPQGPRPPCPRTGPRRPGSPHSWAVWGPRWDSSGERPASPSFQSTRCHWLREGVRGCFSGSCTSRPGGKGSAQLRPAPSGTSPQALHHALGSPPASQLHQPPGRAASPLPGMLFPTYSNTANSHLPVFAPTSPPFRGLPRAP